MDHRGCLIAHLVQRLATFLFSASNHSRTTKVTTIFGDDRELLFYAVLIGYDYHPVVRFVESVRELTVAIHDRKRPTIALCVPHRHPCIGEGIKSTRRDPC